MKKVLVILFVLFLLSIIGGVIFIATLDLDKYRPQIISKLESALGLPVKLEKISLTWHQGFALALHGLKIEDPDAKRPLVSLDAAKVLLDFATLLNRRIQMTTIYLERPVIHLTRKEDGTLQGFQGGAKKQKAGPGAALAFFIGKIQIDSGEVTFLDEAQAKSTEIRVHDVDILLRDVALNSPIDFDIKAAALSQHQNIHMTGILQISPEEQQIRNVHGETDLSKLDFEGLGSTQVSGRIAFDVTQLMLTPEGFRTMVAEVHLTDGGVRTPDLKIKKIGADILAQTGSVQIKNLSADYGGGKISGTGNVNLKTPKPLAAFDLSLSHLSLEQVVEASSDPRAPKPEGMISAAIQGTASGANGSEMIQTLNAKGQIQGDEVVIRNLNVLREVFQKVSMIPTLRDTLQKNLPEGYQEKLEKKDTFFERIQQPLIIQDGVLLVNPIDIRSESFALRGTASANLIRFFAAGQAFVLVEPEFSQALIATRPELQSLADRQGIIQIPLIIDGPLSKARVRPDLESIGSRVAMAATQNILTSIMRPQESPSPTGTSGPSTSIAPSDPATQPSKPKLPKGKDLLGAFLQSALAPEESQPQT